MNSYVQHRGGGGQRRMMKKRLLDYCWLRGGAVFLALKCSLMHHHNNNIGLLYLTLTVSMTRSKKVPCIHMSDVLEQTWKSLICV